MLYDMFFNVLILVVVDDKGRNRETSFLGLFGLGVLERYFGSLVEWVSKNVYFYYLLTLTTVLETAIIFSVNTPTFLNNNAILLLILKFSSLQGLSLFCPFCPFLSNVCTNYVFP